MPTDYVDDDYRRMDDLKTVQEREYEDEAEHMDYALERSLLEALEEFKEERISLSRLKGERNNT